MHETFHNIVHNNPDLMPYLMKALESEYGRQEIAALVNGYIEAYDGIYGTFEDGMTEAQQKALVMKYMEEVFADVYGGIRRGKYRTTAAQKVMQDQTDAVQRAAQNRKGMENKKAPPKQSFAVDTNEDYFSKLKRISSDSLNRDDNTHIVVRENTPEILKEKAGAKDLPILISYESAYLALRHDGKLPGHYHSLGVDRMMEIPRAMENPIAIIKLRNGRINELIEIKGEAKKATVLSVDLESWKTFTDEGSNRSGTYNLVVTIFDAKKNYIWNLLHKQTDTVLYKREDATHFIPRLNELPTNDPVTSSDNRIAHNESTVKQVFSVEDEVDELDEGYARKMTEPEERQGKVAPEWEQVRSSMDEYNAAAKAVKEERAAKNSISALKNRIEKNEQMLRELANMKTMAKKSNFLSMNMEKEIDTRREIIKETLKIDRAALKEKQEAKKVADKEKRQKKQEEELQQVKAKQATDELGGAKGLPIDGRSALHHPTQQNRKMFCCVRGF